MDKQSLLNKISFILQDLKSQHLKLTGNVDRIPEIDLDLFLANASFLVQHLEVLKKINGSSPEVKERDEMLKNLFNHPQDLERFLENSDIAGLELDPNSKNVLTNQSEETNSQDHQESISSNLIEESKPSQITERLDLGQSNGEMEPYPKEPIIQSRNDSFAETRNNFVLPLGNKQGVFAPELERKAAIMADRVQEQDPQNEIESKKEITKPIPNQDLNSTLQENEESSLNDSFKNELKALRELNKRQDSNQLLNPIQDANKPGEIRSVNNPGNSIHQDKNSEQAKNYQEWVNNQKREPSLLNKLGNLPVKDIRKAIGLNEHLLFIKTLFQGDPAIYDRTLSMIDSFSNVEEAFKFLQDEIAIPFNWESKKAVAELFKNIVSRKFAGSRS